MPAQAQAECSAGTASAVASATALQWPDAGASCTVHDEATGVTVSTCVELISDEGYMEEDDATWETPAWSDRAGTASETPCASHAGEAGCDAWAAPPPGLSGWIYPNAGVDCLVAGTPVQQVCVEALPDPWLFAFRVDDVWTSDESSCSSA